MPLLNPGGPLPALATAAASNVKLAVPGGFDDAEFDTSVRQIRATARGTASRD